MFSFWNVLLDKALQEITALKITSTLYFPSSIGTSLEYKKTKQYEKAQQYGLRHATDKTLTHSVARLVLHSNEDQSVNNRSHFT
ncbi:hypothetical protein T4B_6154 [Trichinella pseudospiralis]|uniref:Uncharacterized protein n=1 Tax=Trichinella pseudospiralis TaxID=6337 RepID=A0A0V1IIJ4_TRIPS|nr:hypothetical protein T4B_6154 [Trichinella pseudospiralis]KRZ22525.1 hypothetical protein T4C_9049 [Trichinella pseudospiralis]KRZ25714.1 hypothetical protein T4C_6769 [Trichinella pseudospiralis]